MLLKYFATFLLFWFYIPPNTLAHGSSYLTNPFDYPFPLPGIISTTAPTKTVNLVFPSVQEAKYYVHFTGAAYCLYGPGAPWTCTECKLTGPDVSLVQVYADARTNTLALFNINHSKREIIVTYRGSANVQNFVQDLLFYTYSIPGGNGNMKVHRGFYIASDALYPKTVEVVGNLVRGNRGYRVAFVGHSLGAAMAILNGIRFRSIAEFKDLTYAFFLYGQPRTGNVAFADFVNSQRFTLVRVTDKSDIVPHLPPRYIHPAYMHHTNEVWIQPNGNDRRCSTSVYEDPNCSNSRFPLVSVLHHLDYWKTGYVQCAVKENWCPFLLQLVIPLPIVAPEILRICL